jgi:hypothetical protein
MLVELERRLVALLQASPLAEKVRAIDVLPDLDGDSLVGKFLTDAPALYVSLGAGDISSPGVATPTIGVACVTRNSRSATAARHGDGVTIGLLELVEAVMILVDPDLDGETGFAAVRWDPVVDPVLYKKGLYAAVVLFRAGRVPPTDYTGDPYEEF